MLLPQPGDHFEARAEGETLAGQATGDDEERGEPGPRDDQPGTDRAQGEALGRPDEPRKGARTERAPDTDEDGTAEVAVLEDRTLGGVDEEDRVGVAEGDEHEVARRAGDERGEQHAPRHLVAERNLEREDRSGCRCLEDRRHTGRRPGDEERPMIGPAERGGEAPLDHGSDRGPAVQRRTLEPHRAPEAERGDRSGDAAHERAHTQGILGVVEGAEVLVRRRRRRAGTNRVEDDRGDHQPDTGRDRGEPERSLDDQFEYHLDDDVLEEPDEEPCERTGDRREEDDLSRAADEDSQFAGADIEGRWTDSHHRPWTPHGGEV